VTASGVGDVVRIGVGVIRVGVTVVAVSTGSRAPPELSPPLVAVTVVVVVALLLLDDGQGGGVNTGQGSHAEKQPP
jgi:hypothetical protein